MLTLAIKEGEVVQIGQAFVKVHETHFGKCRLSIAAPLTVGVQRHGAISKEACHEHVLNGASIAKLSPNAAGGPEQGRQEL